MADKKVALVLGGTGMVGRNLVMLLDTKEDWETIVVSRREPYFKTKARHIPCDMNEPEDCVAKLTGIDDVGLSSEYSDSRAGIGQLEKYERSAPSAGQE